MQAPIINSYRKFQVIFSLTRITQISSLIVLILYLFLPASTLKADHFPGDIISDINAPGDFPSGLTFDGSMLWCADRRNKQIYQLYPETGDVQHTISCPGSYAAGLSWYADRLWHVDGLTKRAYRINPADGRVEFDWQLVGSDPTGIIVENDLAFITDWNDAIVYIYDITTGDLVEEKPAPNIRLWGSAHNGSAYWFVDARGKEIYAIDVNRWQLFASLPTNFQNPSGITSIGRSLWISDIGTGKIYECDPYGDIFWAIRDDYRERIDIKLTDYVNIGSKDVELLEFHTVLPLYRHNQNVMIQNGFFAPTPNEFIVDEWECHWLKCVTGLLPVGDWIQVAHAVPLIQGTIRYVVYPEQVGTIADVPDDIKDKWTGPIRKDYSMDDPFVQQCARDAVGSETNVFWMVMSIHDYIIERVHYAKPAWKPVKDTLTSGFGVCADFSKTMVSLCRLNGIPARQVQGQLHVTVEVWLPGPNVWYPIDPTHNRTQNPDFSWKNREKYGTRTRIIDDMGSRPDYNYWKNVVVPKGSVVRSSHVRIILDDLSENHCPLYTGHRKNPVLIGNNLIINVFPAFDPDGDSDITYAGYLSSSKTHVPQEEDIPDIIAETNRSICCIDSVPENGDMYLRVIPMDYSGEKLSMFRTDEKYNEQITRLTLVRFCEQWLIDSADLSGDIFPDQGDGIVNFKDFAEFALYWQGNKNIS